MSNALIQAGAQPKGGNSHWAPIFSNEFFSGLYTNRNPLRDPATQFLASKFYSATRYEALWAGLNMEITPRLTLARAPGHSVFNSSTFTAIDDYYSYKISGLNISNYIRVMVDTSTGGLNDTGIVYDATPDVPGGSGQTVIFNKAVGAGQTRFLAVGNTLYMGDGVDLFELITSGYKWKPHYTMPVGAYIIDQDQNVQLSLGYTLLLTQLAVSGGILTATTTGTTNLAVGVQVLLEGLIGPISQYMNGITVTVTSVTPGTGFTAAYEGTTFSETQTHVFPPYPGAYAVIPSINGTNGPTEPLFVPLFSGVELDGTNLWQMQGPALRQWGVPAPILAPTVQNTPNTVIDGSWVANTFFLPSPYIYVGTTIYQLTGSGTTGTFGGGFPTDGSATWVSLGTSVRGTGTPYLVGAVILVTWTVTNTITTTNGYNQRTGQPNPTGSKTVTTTYSQFFQCTQPGTTNGGATAYSTDQTAGQLWTSSLSSTVLDGTVTWENIGIATMRSGSASVAPSFNGSNVQQPGNIGDNQLITNINAIIDTNGAVEEVLTPGVSGALVPKWSTISAGTVIDNTATPSQQFTWSNVGNSPAVGGTAAGTAPWVYTYAYMDDITGAVGPAAPLSVPITLAAGDFIQMQGVYTTLPSIATINIYRSTMGQLVPFLIAQIPNLGPFLSALGTLTWTYNDLSPDQGFPLSTMNNLIEADLVGYNSPPPVGFLPVTLHLSSIWGYVNNYLYYSAGTSVVNFQGGAEAFPGTNYIAFQSKGQVAWSTYSGLYAILSDSIQLVAGAAAPFNVSEVVGIGILSPHCFTLNGQTPYLYTSDRQIVAFDSTAGVTGDGFPIADLLAAAPFSPTSAYMTWYVNGIDQRLIVSDGSTGYHTMLNNIPPEPPAAVWSPKRQIVGGCSAVKTVETLPGEFQLLVGPASSGPILYRDTTSAQDNGASYPAWVVMGSNVLAHSGQIAEIGFIHIDAKRVGSVPMLSVLMEEIYGWPGCPEVDNLTASINDPPRQPESQSTYSKRYLLSQTGNPAWCRHMQMMISFGTDNALNELLSITIFGAIHVERTEGGA